MNKDAKEMIRELIEKVGNDAKDIIVNGLNLQQKGSNYRCPKISNHKNGDKNPSLSWKENDFYFHCFTCGEHINIYTYYKNYLNYSFSEIMNEENISGLDEKRTAFRNNFKSEKEKLNDSEFIFLEKRGINKDTIKNFKLYNSNNCIGIPYLKNNLLIAVKKRTLSGKIKNLSITGSKFYLYNSDNTTFDEPVVITEGEFDAMIVYQSGYKNVMSVGTGANSVNNLFEQAGEFLTKFNSIVLFTDNDKYGLEMDKKFIDKFKRKISTVDKNLYKGEKDANDIYLKYGKEQILKIIESGKTTFDGEWDLERNPYTELDYSGTKFIKTGIKSLDYAINTIQSKTVSLITGRSNAGKSTFVNQIMISAIEEGFKCYLVAGEGEKNKIMNKFYSGIVGSRKELYIEKAFGLRTIKEPKPEVLKAIQKWHKNKLKLFVKSLSKYKNESQLFEMLEYKIRTEHYDLIILDNLMSLLVVSDAKNKNEAQGQFVEKCHHLAKSTNCAIIIVLHPNKTYKAGKEMEFEQISGTSDMPNKADTIINVIRIINPEDNIGSKIQVAKNRDFPELPTIDCMYDYNTNSYLELVKGNAVRINASGWEKYLSDDVDKNTYERIVVKDESPF